MKKLSSILHFNYNTLTIIKLLNFGTVYTFQNIQIVDSSNLSLEGWAGSRKITHILKSVNSDTIVVWDEFDKLTHPKIGSNGLNVSTELQAEFLKLIEDPEYVVSEKDGNVIKNLGTGFVGAFSSIREDKTRCANKAIGFNSQKNERYIINEEITRDDLFEFGMIGELLSRVATICNTQPMTKEHCFDIVHHSKSRLTIMQGLFFYALTGLIALAARQNTDRQNYGCTGNSKCTGNP